jgi:hypothetical protein
MALEIDAVKMVDLSLFGGRACLYIPSREDWSGRSRRLSKYSTDGDHDLAVPEVAVVHLVATIVWCRVEISSGEAEMVWGERWGINFERI